MTQLAPSFWLLIRASNTIWQSISLQFHFKHYSEMLFKTLFKEALHSRLLLLLMAQVRGIQLLAGFCFLAVKVADKPY